jgi:hypothetical protein
LQRKLPVLVPVFADDRGCVPPDIGQHSGINGYALKGDSSAVEPLVEMLKGDFWDNHYAEAALRQLGITGPCPECPAILPTGR